MKAPLTDEEVNKLALDLFNGKIFTDRHVRTPEELKMVFIVLAFGAFDNFTDEQRNDIGLIYEYIDKAGPRGVNGYPMFTSLRYLTKADTDRVHKKCHEIKAAVEAVTKETSNG